MDSALALFIRSKKQFLNDFASGKIFINPVLIGLVLSISQHELGNDLILFECLERLIFDLNEPLHRAYCLGKFFKSCTDYLQKVSEMTHKFSQIYYRIGIFLPNFPVAQSMKESIAECFNRDYLVLLKSYAKSVDFIKILKVGRKNISMFTKIPEIFVLNIDEDLEKIAGIREEFSIESILLTIYQICYKLKSSNVSKYSEISLFLTTIIKIIYVEKPKSEVILDLSKKLPEFQMIFDEESKLEIDGLHREILSTWKQPNIRGVFGNGQGILKVIDDLPKRNEPPQKEIVKKQLDGAPGLIQIPKRHYGQSVNFFENPEVSREKFYGNGEINSKNPEIYQNFNPQPQTNLKNPEINRQIDFKTANQVKFSENYGQKPQHPIIFPQNYVNNVMNSIPSPMNRPQENLEKASSVPLNHSIDPPLVIPAYDEKIILQITEIIEYYKKNYSSTQVFDSDMFKTYLMSFSEFSLCLHKELEESLKKLIEKEKNRENLDFWKLFLESVEEWIGEDLSQCFLDKIFENVEKLEREEDSNGRRGRINMRRRPSNRGKFSGNPENFYGNQNFSEEIPEYYGENQMKPERNVPVQVKNPENPIQSEKNISPANVSSVSLSSPEALSIVSLIKATTEDIFAISQLLTALKNQIKYTSPSASLKLIGSVASDSHIKNTDVDVVFIDFLEQDPLGILVSAISQLNLGLIHSTTHSIYLLPQNFTFYLRFLINDEISNEVSLLINHYCKIDSRCNSLILLVKLWARNNSIYGQGLFTGFHLSLLVISFLQLSEPAVLPKLQQFDHKERTINSCDVWYNKDLQFKSLNFAKDSELLKEFFKFLLELSKEEYVVNTKNPIISLIKSQVLFGITHPFTGQEISQISRKSPAEEKIVKVIKKSITTIEEQSGILKTMNNLLET